MSFFENPFAEEEAEEVIPEEPFGDYDEEKRENDYNTLVISARVLDANLEKKMDKHRSELNDCIDKNAQLRRAFDEQRYTWRNGMNTVENDHEATSIVTDALPTLYRESDEALWSLIRKRKAIHLYQSKLELSLVNTQKEATTEFGIALTRSLYGDAACDKRGELTVGVRTALAVPGALGDEGCPEEYQLLVALCGHLRDALQTYASLIEEVQCLEGALERKLVEWERVRNLLNLNDSVTLCADEPEDTQELSRLLGATSKVLYSRVDQIERTLAVYDKKGSLEVPSSFTAVWPNITALKLKSQIQLFSAHAENLAGEVTALRSLIRRSVTLPKNEDQGVLASTPCEDTEEWKRFTDIHKYHRSLRHRIEALRRLCLQSDGKALSGEAMTLLSILEKFVDVQDAFLHSVAILNSHFKKQALSAVYLQRILLHDAEMDANTLSRALDVQRDGQAIQSEVLSRLKAPDIAQPFEAATMKSVVDYEDGHAQIEFCRNLCEVVKQEVGQFVTDTFPSQTSQFFRSTSCPKFCLQEDESGANEALQAESESAKMYNAGFLEDCKAVLTQRYSEMEKKVTWLERQQYAKPLVELYTISKEIEQLRSYASATTEQPGVEASPAIDLEALQSEIAEEEAAIKEMERAISSLDAMLVSLA